MRRAVEKVHGISLPAVSLSSGLTCKEAFKQAKSYFAGLLDALNGSGTHPYLSLVVGLPRVERLALASSLASGKKLLPDPCPGMLSDIAQAHADVMRTPLEVPEEYLSHCVRLTMKLFRKGWDKGYRNCVEGSTPPLSAAIGFPRSKGGVAMCGFDRDVFRSLCNLETERFDFPVTTEFTVVVAEGKARGITVTHPWHGLLRPLHHTVYNHLSKKDWLLRGDATVGKLSEFGHVDGELMVSGDYESATDGLSLEVARVVLRTILNSSTEVPSSVKCWAMKSLQSEIRYPDGSVVVQKRGQLMGNLLSFPLLCLQNYLAFKYLVPRRVPLKINGDDIVFRGTRAEYERWRDGLQPLGLKLSSGKTFLDHKYISVNSTYFYAKKSGVRVLGVMRLGMLKRPDGVSELGASHNRFIRPFEGDRRYRASSLFLTSQRYFFKLSGRSLLTSAPDGLGVRIRDERPLWDAGLMLREAWYLRNFRPTKDIPRIPREHNIGGMPDGWRKKMVAMSRGRKKFFADLLRDELLDRRWKSTIKMEPKRMQEYYDSLRAWGGEGYWRTYVNERRVGQYDKSLRLLKASGFSSTNHPMKLRTSTVVKFIKSHLILRRKGEGVWVKEEGRERTFVLSNITKLVVLEVA